MKLIPTNPTLRRLEEDYAGQALGEVMSKRRIPGKVHFGIKWLLVTWCLIGEFSRAS